LLELIFVQASAFLSRRKIRFPHFYRGACQLEPVIDQVDPDFDN
jgi:hypothetical protein